MGCGGPILKAVVTKGKDVVNVTHLGRRPNAAQQTALDWLFPSCAAEGCGTRAAHLQSDHRVDWSKVHVTVLDLLDTVVQVPPLPEDLSGLGFGARTRQASVRPARRPPPSSPPP